MRRRIKKKELRKIIEEGGIDVVFVQETKITNVDKSFFHSLWGVDEVAWLERETINVVGCLFIAWKKELFQMKNSFFGSGFIRVQGVWRKGKIQCMIMYVYSLCTMLEKRKLLEDLHQVKKSIGKWDMVCVGRF